MRSLALSPSLSFKSNPRKLSLKVKPLESGMILEASVFSWITVGELKLKLESLYGIPHRKLRLFNHNEELLKTSKMVGHYITDEQSLVYVAQDHHDTTFTSRRIQVSPTFYDTKDRHVLKLIETTGNALLKGSSLELTASGTSGSYFIRDTDKSIIAIFKPSDEEPNAPNNPRNMKGSFNSVGLKPGVLSGESAAREVIAYLLDKESFHGVPATTHVDISLEYTCEKNPNTSVTKSGSLQGFADHSDAAENFGSCLFPVAEVHKIAILDIRILNCDRNDQNILVKCLPSKTSLKNVMQPAELIPIDHGLSLPDSFSINEDDVVWMKWSQAQKPFSQQELDFIANINPSNDVELISKKFKLREVCLRNFRIAETVLKKAAEKGLTLYDIGKILYRPSTLDDDEVDDNNEGKCAPIEEIIKVSERLTGNIRSLFRCCNYVEEDLLRPRVGLRKSSKKCFPQRINNSKSHKKKVKEPHVITQNVIDEETDVSTDNRVFSSGDDAFFSSTDIPQYHIFKEGSTIASYESTTGSNENSGKCLFKTKSLFTPERTNLYIKSSSNTQPVSEELKIKKTRSFSMNEADEGRESNNTILPTLELFNHSVCDRSQINALFSSHAQSDMNVVFNEQAGGLKRLDRFIVDDESQDSDCDCKLQNTRLKRALSLPYLHPVTHSFKHNDETSKKEGKDGGQGRTTKFSVNSKKINKQYHKDDDKVNAMRLVKKNKGDSDRIFFHYLESLLDQLILKLLLEKSKLMNQHRNRFKSNDNSA